MVSVINWILLHLGSAANWLWGAVAGFCASAWHSVESAVNPVMSPVMGWVNPVFTVLMDGVYRVLARLPAWAGLTVLAAVCGVLMLVVYRYTSNQAAIGRARDRLGAQLLALRLYKDDIRVALRTQGRLLAALLRWQWLMLRPIAIMIVLLLPVFGQMGTRYQWRPLRPGEQTLLRVRLAPGHEDVEAARLEPDTAFADAVGPVPGGGELVWRIRGALPGRHTLRLTIDGQTVEKELVVGRGLERVSAVRPGRDWGEQIIHPIESPLPADGVVRSVEIAYAGEHSYISGANWWVLYFLVISMAAACAMLPFWKVRF